MDVEAEVVKAAEKIESCSQQNIELHVHQVDTVDGNIIATIKIRNNFCYSLKIVIFQILR